MSVQGDEPGGAKTPSKLQVVSGSKNESDQSVTNGTNQKVGTPEKPLVDLAEKRWRNALFCIGTKKGGPVKKILANILIALRQAPVWQGVFRYNAFSHKVEIQKALPWSKDSLEEPGRAWNDNDDGLLAEWLQREAIDVTSKQVGEAVMIVARENEYHPVLEYLTGLKWDGEPRLDTWLVKYMNTEDNEYSQLIGPKIWIQLVARVVEPGCKADCMPIFIGDQGQRKSTILRVMASPAWFTDQIGGVSSGKETSINMSGKWLVEFSDLEGFHGKSADDLKAFMSRQTDRYRAVFGRYAGDYPRQVCFAGTTNQRTPLKDFTGNRRYWPIHTGAADVEAMERDRDQLWAEAYQRYQSHEPWWLDTPEARALAAEVADESRETDVLEEHIDAFLSRLTKKETSISQIVEVVLEKEIADASRSDQMRVAACLQALKWERVQSRVKDVNGDRRIWIYKPITLNKPKP